MRITVPHQKSPADAVVAVEAALDQFCDIDIPGVVQIVSAEKSWDGPRMTFSLDAKVGPFRNPIPGEVLVGEKEITFEFHPPKLLTQLVPESMLQTAVESRVKSML